MSEYSNRKWYDSLADAKAAYFEYLDKHHEYILKAFDKYGKKLSDALDVDISKVKELVDIHDQSKKESEDEINGYISHFYPYKNDDIGEESFGLRRAIYEKGLLHHYNSNPHHPEFWIYVNVDKSKMEAKPMDGIYIAEMLLDWIAFSMVGGCKSVEEYWKHNRASMYIHHDTVKIVDRLVDMITEDEKQTAGA